MTSRTLAKRIAELVTSKKAHDIVLMDLRKLSTAMDFFVVCTADSATQVKAVSDAVMEGTERIGVTVWHSEGQRALQWVLLDYVDVVVHVFHKEVRSFYSLERLWSDAKLHPVVDEGKRMKILPATSSILLRKSPAKKARRASA